MDIYVHRLHRKIDLQHADRKTADHELIFIRFFQRGREHPRFDEPAVDKEILIRAVAARTGRLGHKAADRKLFPRAFDLYHIVGDLAAKDGIDRRHAVAGAGGGELLLTVF